MYFKELKSIFGIFRVFKKPDLFILTKEIKLLRKLNKYIKCIK